MTDPASGKHHGDENVTAVIAPMRWLAELLGVRYVRWGLAHEPWSYLVDFAGLLAAGALVSTLGWVMWGDMGAIVLGVAFLALVVALKTRAAVTARNLARDSDQRL